MRGSKRVQNCFLENLSCSHTHTHWLVEYEAPGLLALKHHKEYQDYSEISSECKVKFPSAHTHRNLNLECDQTGLDESHAPDTIS